MTRDIEQLFRQVVFLKEKQEALHELLDGLYAEILEHFSATNLTKFSVEDVTARVKKSSKLVVTDADGLLSCVTDPLQFSRTLLHTLTLNKKVVQALEQLGVPASKHVQKSEGKPYLEVTTKTALSEDRIHESRKEYYRELEALKKELELSVVAEGMESFICGAVFPESPELGGNDAG